MQTILVDMCMQYAKVKKQTTQRGLGRWQRGLKERWDRDHWRLQHLFCQRILQL